MLAFFLCPIHNGQMLGQNDNSKNFKSLKDTGANTQAFAIKDISVSISYTKTNKLITALYIVTDIIDRDEPLRNKLRTLGAEILSDIHQDPLRSSSKIAELMSFLGIARTLGIVSEMNSEILEVEFSELAEAVSNASDKMAETRGEVDLAEFFREEFFHTPQLGMKDAVRKFQVTPADHSYLSKRHPSPTRIGVQKGATLLSALKGVQMSDTNTLKKTQQDFDILKRQRRAEIVSFIRHNAGSATITDIRTRAVGTLATCGEKTLQRELISMIKDGVLKKTGEKRWSRYFLA